MRLPAVIRGNGVISCPSLTATGNCSSEHYHYTG